MADEHNRVDRLEPPLEQPEEPETHRRVDTSAVLIGDDPAEDTAGAQDPMGFGCDLFHLLIEPRVAAGDPAETSGVGAVYDVVGVRRINHRKSSGLRREGPRSGIGTEDVWPTGREVERDSAPTERSGHVPDRPGPGHGVYNEFAGSRAATDDVRSATRRGDSVARGLARIAM